MSTSARARQPSAAPWAAGTLLALVVTAAATRVLGVAGLLVPVGVVATLVLVSQPFVTLLTLTGLLLLAESLPGSFPPTERLYEGVGPGIAPSDVLIGILLVAVVLDRSARRGVVRLPPAFGPALGLIGAGVLAGSITGWSAGVGPGAIYAVVKTLVPLMLVPVLTFVVLDRRERLVRFLVIVAVMTVGKAVIGIAAAELGLTSDPSLATVTGGAGGFTYYEPTINLMCLLLGFTGLALLLRRVHGLRWVLWSEPLIIGSLVLSYRRSFWIGAVLGSALTILLGLTRVGRRLAVPAALLVVLGGWAVFSLGGAGDRLQGGVVDRAASLSPTKISTNVQDRYRIDERTNVLESISHSPIAGLGIGVGWTATHPLPLEHAGGRQYVHMGMLWFWSKLGILGLLGYIALFAGVAWNGLQISRSGASPWMACVGTAVVAGVAGLGVAELTASFTGPDARFTVVVAILVGVVGRLRLEAAAEEGAQQPQVQGA